MRMGRRVALRVGGGLAAFAWWLALGMIGMRLPSRMSVSDGGDVLGVLAWFTATAALAAVAGWQRDWVMALAVLLGGILGAAVAQWAAGVPEVEPGADPAMRSFYEQMVLIIAAGFAAVVGLLVVVAGYAVGRIAARRVRDGPG
jgi:hypothetical protein